MPWWGWSSARSPRSCSPHSRCRAGMRWTGMSAPIVESLAVVPIVALAPVLNSMFGADSQFGRQAIASARGLRAGLRQHASRTPPDASRPPRPHAQLCGLGHSGIPHRDAADRGPVPHDRHPDRQLPRGDIRPRRRGVLRRAARRSWQRHLDVGGDERLRAPPPGRTSSRRSRSACCSSFRDGTPRAPGPSPHPDRSRAMTRAQHPSSFVEADLHQPISRTGI